jgi:hypothetical protein
LPLAINTSFNKHEEPIVSGPADALSELGRNAVDVLFWKLRGASRLSQPWVTMQRLMDHFVPALPAGPPVSVAAEMASGRPALRHGRLGGTPLWFHAVEGDGRLRTDEGQPFDADDAIACLQFEHYVDATPAEGARRARALYYKLKPFMPRPLQLELQRANARRLRGGRFPAWPHDATLTELLGQCWCTGCRKPASIRFRSWASGRVATPGPGA